MLLIKLSKIPLTLLRYPGGKSKAIKILERYVPDNIDTMYSLFLGGASFEIHCCINKNIRVFGYDIFEPLINFWECVLTDNAKLKTEIEKIHPLSKEQFFNLRKID